MKARTFTTTAVAIIAVGVIALTGALFTLAGATDTPVHVHGPHGQADCTKSQARLSILKVDVEGIPGPPTGFAPYTPGPVTGDDGSWHVTLTADVAFATSAPGSWAGYDVPGFSFADGNEECVPPSTTTTTTVPEETTTTTTTAPPANSTPPPAAAPSAPPAQPVVSSPAKLGITG